MSATALYQLITRNKTILSTATFLNPKRWIDSWKTSRVTGMRLARPDEINDLERISNCPVGWLSSILRICPICLEHGYHTYWYQLRDLQVCPIHCCAIIEKCHCCGNNLPLYVFSKSIFDNPYYCLKCDGPISGVAPELSLFRDFRENHVALKYQFSSLTSVKRHLSECSPICRVTRSMRECVWYRHDEISLSVGRLAHQQDANDVYAQAIQVLGWKIKMSSLYGNSNNSARVKDYKSVSGVWGALIRRLYYWIYGAPPNPHYEEVNSYFLNNYTVIDLNGLDVRQVAFSVFMEHYIGVGFQYVNDRIITFGLRELPNVGIVPMYGRIPRSGFMYAMLSVFAGIVMTIKHIARKQRYLNIKHLRLEERRWGAVYFEHSTFNVCTGAVAFPRLDDYPVKWSATIKAYLSCKYREHERQIY